MNDFGRAVTFFLYERLESEGILHQLYATSAYKEAREEYKKICMELQGETDLAGGSPEQSLVDAIRHMNDMEAQCIYRLGLQDGIKMTHGNFLTEGVL